MYLSLDIPAAFIKCLCIPTFSGLLPCTGTEIRETEPGFA